MEYLTHRMYVNMSYMELRFELVPLGQQGYDAWEKWTGKPAWIASQKQNNIRASGVTLRLVWMYFSSWPYKDLCV